MNIKIRVSYLLAIVCLALMGCDLSDKKINDIDNRVKKLEEQKSTNNGEWVLWRSPTCFQCVMMSIPYYAERAFSSEQQCRNRVVEIGKALNKSVNGIEANSDAMIITYDKGQDAYYCLPNSIDPRKPKN